MKVLPSRRPFGNSLKRVVLIGAGGRLGSLIASAAQAQGVSVVSVGRSDALASKLAANAGEGLVVIDVSTAGSTAAHAECCAASRVPYVVATTGLSAADDAALDVAARSIAVLAAANVSVSAHLVARVVQELAAHWPDADVEIVEVHHNKKKDAPSGTARLFASAAAAGRTNTASPMVHGRAGVSQRQAGEIGVSAVRGGDVVGEHTVMFLGNGERIEVVHKVTDRAVFARGALRAAGDLLGRAPGRYHMSDITP